MAYYTIRNTSPAGLYLPYYMKTGTYTGAINNAILGNTPQGEGIGITGANVLNNCVGYSVGRMAEEWNEVNGTQSSPTNPFNVFAAYNAQDWYNVAVSEGYRTGNTPQPAAVGVYVSADGQLGHVVNVERFYNNRWEISESHYYYDGDQNLHGSWDYSYLDSNNMPAFLSGSSWQFLGFFYPLENVTPGTTGGGSWAGIKGQRNFKRSRGKVILL